MKNEYHERFVKSLTDSIVTDVEKTIESICGELAGLVSQRKMLELENAELRRRAEVAETKIRYRELLEGDYTKISGAFDLCLPCTEVDPLSLGQEKDDAIAHCRMCRHAMAWAIAADEVEKQND